MLRALSPIFLFPNVLGLMVLAIAVLWPIVVVLYTIHDARNHLAQHPRDDAPGMVVVSVIYFGAPFLFFASLPPTIAGSVIARRKNSSRQTPRNTSLGRSGGGVFCNIKDVAKVA
jgi:hypothetical protein